MKYFSEKTNKTYDTEKACLDAEKEFDDVAARERMKKEKLAEERKARASEVEGAYKAVLEAQKIYSNLSMQLVRIGEKSRRIN